METKPKPEEGAGADPDHFFDRFDRFVRSSETGRWLAPGTELRRLNTRCRVLIHENRHLLADAKVLDLASHDGRFSFAALQNGAEHVVGIDIKARLARQAVEHMQFYGVPPTKYRFMTGDLLDAFEVVEDCDVVLCFGILYHITNHMELLSKIAELQPRWLIIDSCVSRDDRAVIEFHNINVARGESGFPPPPGSELEGYPSKAGLDAMLSSFGWTFDYFDWPASGLSDPDPAGTEPGTRDVMDDYFGGRRVSAVVNCSERFSQETIDDAVQQVRGRFPMIPRPWHCIAEVAGGFGMTPQALAMWVRKAERDESRRVSRMIRSQS